MMDIPGWDQYFKDHPDHYKAIMEAGEKLQARYQFPKPLDKFDCQESTIDFACSRYRIDRKYIEISKNNFGTYNPVYEILCKEYPLPIGYYSIHMTFQRKRWYWTELANRIPDPLVENEYAFVGLAKRFASKDTVGWFLGLVKVYDPFLGKDKELGEIDSEAHIYVHLLPPFEFIEGMVLLEGKLDDDLVNIPLKEYIKYYNKNILGKKVPTGRPFSKETDSIIQAAKIAIKQYPLDKQLMIANEIGIPERTLQFHIKRSKYKNWKGLHDSVIKGE